VNKSFVIEGVEYTVESAADLGNDLYKYNGVSGLAMGHSNGGKFILVKFTAKNIGTAASSLQNIAIFLTDSAGRNYSPVGYADRVMLQIEGYDEFINSSFDATVVKPGITTKLFILAEVAADSSGFRVIIANQKDQNYAVRLSL